MDFKTADDIKDVVEAGFGMATSELPSKTHETIHNLPDTVLSIEVNPDRDTIFTSMLDSIKKRQKDYGQEYEVEYGLEESWTKVPWNKDYSLNLINLAEAIIANADYHEAPINQELYPVEQCLEFINRVKEVEKVTDHSVEIDGQFEIALQLADGYPLAAALIAHLATRAIARNSDSRIDPRLSFTDEQMVEWAHTVARFKQSEGNDSMGDTYHFWANCLMGMALSAKQYEEPQKVAIIKSAFEEGPQIMSNVRAMFGKDTKIVHTEVDMMGLEIGWNLADRALSYSL
jgi:hypothetical protein